MLDNNKDVSLCRNFTIIGCSINPQVSYFLNLSYSFTNFHIQVDHHYTLLGFLPYPNQRSLQTHYKSSVNPQSFPSNNQMSHITTLKTLLRYGETPKQIILHKLINIFLGVDENHEASLCYIYLPYLPKINQLFTIRKFSRLDFGCIRWHLNQSYKLKL